MLVAVEGDLDAPLVAAAGRVVPVVHDWQLYARHTSISLPLGPRLITLRGTDLVLGAPGLVDVAADGEGRALGLDRLEDRLAAQMVARARGVAVSLRRGVDDEHGALGAAGEPLGCLLLVEVEAPVPRRDRDPGAEAEELRAVDLGALPVEHRRGLPALAGRPQRILGLVVAGHEDRRDRDRPQRVDRLPEALVDRGEVAGGDHRVGLGGALDQVGRLVEVAMQVAEREQLHGPQSATAELRGLGGAPLPGCRRGAGSRARRASRRGSRASG